LQERKAFPLDSESGGTEMSRNELSRTVRGVLMTSVVIAFAFATAQAAEPNAPPDETKTSTPTTAQPLPANPMPSVQRTPPQRTPVAQPSTQQVLARRVPARRTPASFTPDMPFGEAMDILRNCTTPPLNIVVLWKEIGENTGIDRDTPIGMDGVSGLRLRQSLELLLLSVSGAEPVKLGYVVHNGVVTVGTTDSLPAPRRVTRIYDISDLVAPPSMPLMGPMGFGGMGYGNMGYGNMGYGNTGYGNTGYNGLYGGVNSMGAGPGYPGSMGQPGLYRGR
jgi:hypothetical protein